eukprot:759063-Hanusia_phi.AAC.3
MGREGRKMKGLLVLAMAMAESSTAFMSLSPSSCPAPPLLLPSSSSYMRPRARRSGQSFVMAESTGSRAEQKKEETDEVGTRSRRLVKMSLMLARLGSDPLLAGLVCDNACKVGTSKPSGAGDWTLTLKGWRGRSTRCMRRHAARKKKTSHLR